MKKSTTLSITIIAASIIGVAGLALAQGPWRGSANSLNRDLPPEYRFTQEQVQDLEKIRGKYADKLLKVEKELAAKQVELESTWAQPDIASSEVNEIQRQVLELESRAADLRLAANADAAEILNTGQRGYFGANFEVVGSYGWSCPWDGAVGSFGWNCPWEGSSSSAGASGWVERSDMRRLARGCGCGSCW
jgi:hypothetical protein